MNAKEARRCPAELELGIAEKTPANAALTKTSQGLGQGGRRFEPKRET